MKPLRKLSLRREALGELATNELSRVNGANRATTDINQCVVTTHTFCGLLCDINELTKAIKTVS